MSESDEDAPPSLAEILDEAREARGLPKRQVAVELARAAGDDPSQSEVLDGWRRNYYRWINGTIPSAEFEAPIEAVLGVAPDVIQRARGERPRGGDARTRDLLPRVEALESHMQDLIEKIDALNQELRDHAHQQQASPARRPGRTAR